MSNFTTRVRYLCESFGGEAHGVREIDAQIERASRTIFDFDFPMFSEEYRGILEKKILRHYYMREIGAETFGLWQLQLCDKLNEIMPYYNQLYASQLLEVEPLINQLTSVSSSNSTDVNDTTSLESKNDVGGTTSESSSGSDVYGHSIATSDGSSGSSSTEVHGVDTGSNSVIRTPNLIVSDSSSQTTVDTNNNTQINEQLVSGSDTVKYSDWNIESDTPQGALTNLVPNRSSIESSIGVPADGGNTTKYASKIDESTHTEARTANSGKSKVTDEGDRTSNVSGGTVSKTVGTEQTDGSDTKRSDSTTTGSQLSQRNVSELHGGSDTHDVARTGSHTESRVVNEDRSHRSNQSSLGSVLTRGLSGVSQSKLLQEWRETFLNIDKLIIDELECLFIGLYE